MGQISESIADISIITDDNPRTEDPKELQPIFYQGFQTLRIASLNWIEKTRLN